jgi:hypothetical protein
MSSRYFADSSCIQQPAALVERFEEVTVRGGALLHQINRTPEQDLERLLQSEVLLEPIPAVWRLDPAAQIGASPSPIEGSEEKAG